MAELGQQTVEFSTVVRRVAEESFLSLKELVEKSKSGEQSDSEKKISLLKYILKTRQRMLRLHVLAKWCKHVPLVQYCQQLSATLSSHDTCFTQAADSLFFMHEGLQQARAPVYDVPSSIEVLLTGTYQRLPKCIEDLGIQGPLTEEEQRPALKKLDTLLRSKLLEVTLPKEISEVVVSDGTALLRVDGEFKVLLTLGYRGHLSLWRILHLELLVGEKNGLVKLEEMRRHALGDDLERRMAASENPFMILYSILHELCVALIMDTVRRQVQLLRQGRWKDAIRFEVVSDASLGQGGASSMQLGQDGDSDSAGLKTPGLKLIYWLDFEKSSGGSDSGSSPFIKIEPGQDLQIKCLHNSFVIDPLTSKEAEFSLDQSCIDVEKLLLRAIACNKHTRLLEVQRELNRNGQISQATGDVVLKCQGDESDSDLRKKDNKSNNVEYGVDEVLLVRAYGSSYITLGINIRSGRFLLQASRNILPPSALSDCQDAFNQGSMTAAEVFISLRSKSILHLFASIGRFLGLKVYEQGLAALKIPKIILNGSDLLLMGFPRCGSSYYLLMQLEKDFKPLFKLLETQPDASGRSLSVGDSSQVVRFNKIDIGQMQMLEDELNLSLVDWEKLHSFLPNAEGTNQNSEHPLLSDFGLEASMQIAGSPQSSFSSFVDEVFEFEKGSSLPPFPTHNHINTSFNMSPLSHIHQGIKSGITSPKWDGGLHLSQINNITKVTSGGATLNSSLYPSNNMKALLQSGPANSFSSSSPVRSPSIQKLSASKSDQELSSLKSPPHSSEFGPSAMDDDQARLLNESSKESAAMVSGSRSARLLSPLRTSGPRVSAPSTKPGLKSSASGHPVGPLRTIGSNLWTATPVCQNPESGICQTSGYDIIPKHDQNPRKRSLSDILKLIPSVQGIETNARFQKKRKISETTNYHPSPSLSRCSSVVPCKTESYTYGNILAEANHGLAPSSVYVTAFLHVVRHCSLCIKHARLTSQMDTLDIPYVEEVGLRTPSSNLWFRLPFARDDSWQHICLRLGKPGSMYWDVKVNDQHFRDLWELQKESTSTPWGSGVRIANTSDIDSHIRYDPEGVALSYRTVDADSIQRLVADLRRLSNARLFSLGMRKLLGVRVDDKVEDGCANSDNKLQSGTKGVGEVTDKMSEQMRKSFRIEAVGLMSLWFSFGSIAGIVARFVVEWEAGREGCTMHVSPDQLWPHTKFLEDFINGAEVASLLDCIRLTAGPLLALAGAIRPARMTGPASGIHGVTAGPSSGTKQSSFVTSQGLLPSSSSNVNQPASASSVGNPVGGPVMGPIGNHSLHNGAMLSVAGRGGPGIVPSSLLPIDVSVVLRGPYWIRIIYRKRFAVDMRCFAGDQVWLQPATPPKGGPEAGGSLPCPQFRPFIMEHVAQGLSALETNFAGGAHTVGLMGGLNNPNPNSGSQPPLVNGNRVNLTASGGISRSAPIAGNQGGSFSRMSSATLASSSLGGTVNPGLPLRISPGTGVPVHVRGELNTAFIGLGDDGGYGGGWVPLAALKKVLRGILKYLGVLWLFAQLPDLLREILGSILKENEGSLLNLDQEQPALRFFVGGYVFAVSVHRVQLLLQVLSVKRFHQQQQQQQQQQNQSNAQEELAHGEISEICDYFSRRVASEPYDASRVASFITLLTLPISVLREFLKLIAWKKGLSQGQGGEIAPAQRPRIELCLENHTGSIITDENSDNSSTSKSNIHYDRPHNFVDFGLTVVLDPAQIPHINAAGGAAWLPYCVSVRLRYSFGENPYIMLVGMEGSHGGRACWSRREDWENCIDRVDKVVKYGNGSSTDASQGRLRVVAETLQRALQVSLQHLREGSANASSVLT
ncbi:RNA polymerase II transcription mediator [Tasmannia lanceolata]|uniref:RNA polymerase II transcription mediator n=1 Tax=Tasmannia lanceolata TaxID=3420 RepID=UPI004064299E